MNLEILEADLNNSKHAEAVRQLLDEYARLPIGQGSPLTARVLEQLVPGLRRARPAARTRAGPWPQALGPHRDGAYHRPSPARYAAQAPSLRMCR